MASSIRRHEVLASDHVVALRLAVFCVLCFLSEDIFFNERRDSESSVRSEFQLLLRRSYFPRDIVEHWELKMYTLEVSPRTRTEDIAFVISICLPPNFNIQSHQKCPSHWRQRDRVRELMKKNASYRNRDFRDAATGLQHAYPVGLKRSHEPSGRSCHAR